MLLPRPAAFGSALLIVTALSATPARAGLIPTVVTVAPDHGNFRWTYSVVLPSFTKLEAGNYFTIYDFNGRVPGADGAPPGWSLSTPAVGPVPAHVNIFDNPDVPNLVWTYTGQATQTGRVSLGDFWATSRFSTNEEGLFVGYSARASDGKSDTNVTATVIPTPTAPPGVPEPGTLALAGVGFSFLGMVRRVRRGS
jgi:hypothetical protein